MAAISRADATWEGDLMSGSGHVKPESGAFAELPITWASRAERMHGKTSPEELIAAAHASGNDSGDRVRPRPRDHNLDDHRARSYSRHQQRRVPEAGEGSRGRLPGVEGDARKRRAEAARDARRRPLKGS